MHLKFRKKEYKMTKIIVLNSFKMVFNLIFIFIFILGTGYYILLHYI